MCLAKDVHLTKTSTKSWCSFFVASLFYISSMLERFSLYDFANKVVKEVVLSPKQIV